jgi:hypothetical protein
MEESPEELQELISRRLIEQAETADELVKQTSPDIIVAERGGDDPVALEDGDGSENDGDSELEESSAKLPASRFAKVEKSLASLGFFTPSSRRLKDQKVKKISFTREIDGKRVEVSAEIIPSALFGLPITADQDKYLALQRIVTDLMQSSGTVANPIRFKSADLLRLLKRSTNAGKNYNEISEWLDVMSSTTIISDGVVYTAGKKRYARDRFRVFDRAVSVGKELEDGTIAEANYVWLSQWQLENINNKYLLPIDLESYRELKNHIAKALVPLLQIWLFASHRSGTFEKRYDELCEMLTLQTYRAPSLILRQLKPSLDELTVHGYLAKWRIEKTTNQKAYKVIFFHGPKFHRDRRRRIEQKRQATESVVIAESAPADPDVPEPGRLEMEAADSRLVRTPETPVPAESRAAEGAVASTQSDPGATDKLVSASGQESASESTLTDARSAGEQEQTHVSAASDPIDPALIDELATRGIMPSAAMKLLGSLPPDRVGRVRDYLEYWDTLKATKDVGTGLLYNLIRDGDPLPATFETARQREERIAAEEHKARLKAAADALQSGYEAYTRETINRFIDEEFPKDEFARRVAARTAEFNGQPTFWDKLQKPDLTERMARQAVWAEIAKDVPRLSFDDFCRRDGHSILSAYGIDSAELGIASPTDAPGAQ